MIHARLGLSMLCLSALACSSSKEPTPPAPAQPAAAPAPSPHAAAAPKKASTGELVFAAQPGWIGEPVTSTMRKAQFRLPGANGAADASLVIFWFGPEGGGGAEANIERWVGQFEQPDGSDSRGALKNSTRTVNGMEVVEVDLSGIYVAETSPGSGVRVREEDWRLLAAIIEAPEGPYYAKLVGPAATVASHAAAYQAFLDGLGG